MLDALGPLVELAGGAVKSVSTVAILFVAYRWLKKGAAVGFIMTMGAYFFGLLAVLSLTGIVDVNFGALAQLAGLAFEFLGSFLGVITPGPLAVAGGGA